jgi:hypothetical protein
MDMEETDNEASRFIKDGNFTNWVTSSFSRRTLFMEFGRNAHSLYRKLEVTEEDT